MTMSIRAILAAMILASCDGSPKVDVTALAGDVPLTPTQNADQGSRERRRMDVDQLVASIERVTGGLRWTRVEPDNGEVDRFEELAAALGRPDYLTNVSEDRAPGVLFEKFLGDAANDICADLMAVDRGRDEPVFFRRVTTLDTWAINRPAIEANISDLLLFWHGRRVDADSPRLHRWTMLYAAAEHSSGSPILAWRAVCTALMKHPDFATY